MAISAGYRVLSIPAAEPAVGLAAFASDEEEAERENQYV
jgi:hypothetical protein